MGKGLAFTCTIIATFLAATVCAQGGAGGYGQGSAAGYGQGPAAGYGQRGLGGGGGANVGNNPAMEQSEDQESRPEDDPAQGLWETKTAILTPGDHVEYKLTMRKGEVLLAGATSDAFDPALELRDAKGQKLAENDDRVEGDQSPFIVYRFTEAGNYSLRVVSYHSTAGGKFELKLRTLTPMDAPLGATLHHPDLNTRDAVADRFVFRLVAQKGKIYDLRSVWVYRLLRIIGPTGVPFSDFESIPTPDRSHVFLAKASGDYYIEYAGPASKEVGTHFREVAVIPEKTSDTVNFDLSPGELRIVEFPVKPKLIVRSTISCPSVIAGVSAPPSKDERYGGNLDNVTWGRTRSFTWFLMNRDSNLDQTRIYFGDGAARLVLRSTAKSSEKVAVKNVDALPEWKDRETQKGSLDIGDVKLFSLSSKKSELMKVDTKATHFQPVLDIFRMNGDLANTLSDRKSHTASDDLYFPDPDSFVVRLSCDGFGGSGDYSMLRDTVDSTPYALGSTQTLKLDGTNFGLYAINLEKGKRYELILDHPDWPVRVDLLDEDGQFLVSRNIDFDKVSVAYFVPTRSGRHRLWLRSGPGTWHFKFQPNVPPQVG